MTNKVLFPVFPAQGILFFLFCTIFQGVSLAQGCDFTFNPANPCPGDKVTFSVTMPEAGHIYTFLSNAPGSGKVKGNTVELVFPFDITAKTYTVTILDSLNGAELCKSDKSINVRPAPDPSIGLGSMSNGIIFNSITSIFSGCQLTPPISFFIKNTSQTISNNNSYKIDWGDGNMSGVLDNTTFINNTLHVYNQLGSFPIKVTATNTAGCSFTKNYEFYSGSNPKITFGSPGNTQNLCPPVTLNFPLDSFQKNSPGTQYIFKVNGQIVKTYTQNDVPKVFSWSFNETSCGKSQQGSSSGTNTYSVEVTAQNPCGSTPINIGGITINGKPKASIKVTAPPKSCPGALYTFANASYGGAAITPVIIGGTTTYQCDSTTESVDWEISPSIGWKYVTGGPSSQTITIRFDSVGVYTVKLSVQNGAGVCGTDMTTRTVIITSPPKANANVSFLQGANGCLPVRIRLNNGSTGPNLGYKWTITRLPPPIQPGSFIYVNGTSDTSTTPVLDFLKTGKYRIELRSSNTCGDAFWSDTIEIFAPPTFSFTLPTTCEGQPLNLKSNNVTLADGGLPVSITWTFSSGAPGPITLPYPQVPTNLVFPGAGPYTVTATASNTCGSATSTATLTFSQKPVPAFFVGFVPSNGCGPLNITAKDQSVTNTAPANVFRRWELLNAAGNVIGTQTTTNASFNNIQQGQYKLRLRLGNGCDTLERDTAFTIYGKPTVNLAPITNKICGSGSPELKFTFTNGGLPVTYKWDALGGNPDVSTDSLPNITYSQPGVYSITLTINNGLCGTATAVQNVTVSAVPKADVQPTYTGGPKCLPVRINFGLTALAGVTYVWDIKRLPTQANAFQFTSGNANTANPGIVINQCGIYEYSLKASNLCDVNGAVWTKRDTFYEASKILATLNGSPFCQFAELNFVGQNFDDGCDPSTQYNWTFAGGMPALSTDKNPQGIKYSSPDSSRTYDVIVTASNVCGTASKTLSFKIDAPEKIAITAPKVSLCKNDAPITLSAQPAGGQWRWKGSAVSPVFDPSKYPNGKHWLTYEKGSGACTSRDSVEIEVKPLPVVNAGLDVSICIEKQTLTLNAVQPAAGGVWSCVEKPAALSGNVLDLSVAGLDTLTLRYTYTDASTQCSNVDERIVTVIGNTPITPRDTVYCLVPGLVNLPLYDTPGLTYFGAAVQQPGNRFDPVFYGKDTLVTLLFVLTNQADCAYTGSIKVNIIKPLPASAIMAGPDTSICVYNSPLALNGLPKPGSNWSCPTCPPGALYSTGPDQWFFDPKKAPNGGVFTLTYTYGKDNCAQSDSRIITVIQAAPEAGENQKTCVNASAQKLIAGNIAPSGFVAYWAGNGVIDSLTGAYSPKLAGVGQHKVTLHFRHIQTGCEFTAEKTFIVNPLPASAFTLRKPFCTGKDILFENNTLNAATQTWYDNGTQFSTQKTPAGVQLSAGVHVIRLVSQSGEGCADTTEQSIFVVAPPSVVSKPDKTEGCDPLVVHFANVFTSKDTAFYIITSNGLNDTLPATASDSLYFKPGLEDVTYTVRVVAANVCADAEQVFEIKVKARPTAKFAISYPEPCSGAPLTVLVTSNGKPYKNTLYASTGQTFDAKLDQELTLKFFTDSILPLRLLLVSTNDCPPPDSAFIDLVVKPAEFEALARVEADSSAFCAGNKVRLSGFATPGAKTYWKDRNGNKVLGDTIEITVLAGLNSWVFYAEGCGFDSSSVQFSGKTAPDFDIQYLKQICPGTPVEFQVKSNGSVKLNLGDGVVATQFPHQHIYKFSDTTLMLAAAITSLENCVKNWIGSIRIFEQPVANIAVPDSLCTDNEVIVSSIGQGSATCSWKIGNPPVAYDGCLPKVVFKNSGLQAIYLQVISKDGCPDDTTRSIFVRPSPKPILEVMPNTAVCVGTVLRFESKSENATGLLLDFGDGSFATGGPVFEHAYKKGGLYIVKLTATKDGLCAKSATVTVQVYDNPAANITLVENCTQAEGYTLNVNNPNVHAVLTGPNYADSTSKSFKNLQPGLYKLRLVSKTSGCRADTSLQILPVNELHLISISPDTCRYWLGDSCRPVIKVNQLNIRYEWQGPEGLDFDDNVPDPNLFIKQQGSHLFRVTATDKKGCTVSGQVLVIVDFEEDPAVLPNAFTPNGDNQNDLLMVRSRYVQSIKSMYFKVYDNWGNLVFEAPQGCLPNSSLGGCAWDGTFQDEEAQQGTYRAVVEIVYLNGVKKTFTQNIQLLR